MSNHPLPLGRSGNRQPSIQKKIYSTTKHEGAHVKWHSISEVKKGSQTTFLLSLLILDFVGESLSGKPTESEP